MPLELLQTVGDNQEASVLRSLLQAHGIRCVVQGEQHRSMLGMLGPYVELRVLVEREELDRARRVIEEAAAAGPPAEDELEAAPGSLRGAVCPVHEGEATSTCERCGTFLCAQCGSGAVCEECEARAQPVGENRVAKRKVSAVVAFLLLFGLPALGTLAVVLARLF